jgi:hypothetical protein
MDDPEEKICRKCDERVNASFQRIDDLLAYDRIKINPKKRADWRGFYHG